MSDNNMNNNITIFFLNKEVLRSHFFYFKDSLNYIIIDKSNSLQHSTFYSSIMYVSHLTIFKYGQKNTLVKPTLYKKGVQHDIGNADVCKSTGIRRYDGWELAGRALSTPPYLRYNAIICYTFNRNTVLFS